MSLLLRSFNRAVASAAGASRNLLFYKQMGAMRPSVGIVADSAPSVKR